MKKFIITLCTFIATVLGCFIPLLPIPNWGKILIFVVPTISWCIVLILEFKDFKKYHFGINKQKRISIANSFILNARHKIILIGGNLSWAEDYHDALSKKINDGCSVDVYYDKCVSDSAECSLYNNIKRLKQVKCNVYELDDVYGIRCIYSDPENKHGEFKVLSINKTNEHEIREKNRYSVDVHELNKNSRVAKLYKNLYSIIVNNMEVKKK